MSERRTSEVKFRCTPSFKAGLQSAADAAGQSLTEYIESAVWAHKNAGLAAATSKALVDFKSDVSWGKPPVVSAEDLAEAGHPNPEMGAGLSRLGFETRPGHTWVNPDLQADAPAFDTPDGTRPEDSAAIRVVANEAVPPGVVVVASCTRNCRPWEFCACKAAG